MTMSSRRRRLGTCPERSFKRIPKIPTSGFTAQPGEQASSLRKRSVNEALVSVTPVRLKLKAVERASYNGSIEASQASDVGSIPIARSINLVDSVALALLRIENGANWTRFWTQVGPKFPCRPKTNRLGNQGLFGPTV